MHAPAAAAAARLPKLASCTMQRVRFARQRTYHWECPLHLAQCAKHLPCLGRTALPTGVRQACMLVAFTDIMQCDVAAQVRVAARLCVLDCSYTRPIRWCTLCMYSGPSMMWQMRLVNDMDSLFMAFWVAGRVV